MKSLRLSLNSTTGPTRAESHWAASNALRSSVRRTQDVAPPTTVKATDLVEALR